MTKPKRRNLGFFSFDGGRWSKRGGLNTTEHQWSQCNKKEKAHFSHWAGGEAEEGLQEEGSTGLFQRPFKGLTAQAGRAGFVTSVIQSTSSNQLGKVSSK